MAEIHNKKKRMPFVIPPGKDLIDKWLDPDLPPDDVKICLLMRSVTGYEE